MWVVNLLLGVLVVLLITAATGYFVAQEFAYMAVDRSRLAARAARGDAAADRALAVTRRTSFMLSGAQLGITVTGLLVGYVAEPLIGESINVALGATVPAGTGLVIGTVVALGFSTLVQMLFGELFPKNLAISRPEPVALWLARSTQAYLSIFGWLIAVFDQASNVLLRLARIEPVHDVEHAATAQDLEHIVASSASSGTLPRELSLLLDRMIDFPDHDVEHAMVPASRVDTVPDTESVGQVRSRMATGHTRYPVVDEARDVVGMVELKDVLGWPTTADGAGVAEILRPVTLLPTTMGLFQALARMSEDQAELACVLDEYGGLAGILTIEDMAEEIVGELVDEHDPSTPLNQAVAESESTWRMAGDLHLDEIERLLGLKLPEGDFETLAGLVIAVSGDLPQVGERFEISLPVDPGEFVHPGEPAQKVLQVEILELERHVPSSVRVHVPDSHPSDDDRESDARTEGSHGA